MGFRASSFSFDHSIAQARIVSRDASGSRGGSVAVSGRGSVASGALPSFSSRTGRAGARTTGPPSVALAEGGAGRLAEAGGSLFAFSSTGVVRAFFWDFFALSTFGDEVSTLVSWAKAPASSVQRQIASAAHRASPISERRIRAGSRREGRAGGKKRGAFSSRDASMA